MIVLCKCRPRLIVRLTRRLVAKERIRETVMAIQIQQANSPLASVVSYFDHYLLNLLKPLLIGSSLPSVCIRWAPVKYIKTTFHHSTLTTKTVGSQVFKTPIVQQVESSTMLISGDSHSGNMKIEDRTAKNCRSSSPSQPQTMQNRKRTARKMFTGRKAI